MIPPLIVDEALSRNINLIAITDHNATANIKAVQEAAKGTDLHVIPGMEFQTKEEVHVLCLFDTLDQAIRWQTVVDETLPNIENDPDFFGEQFVVDETGDFIRREQQLLLTSSTLDFEDAYHEVSQLGGLFIPAHINRKAYGLISILGLVPPGIELLALEISRHISPHEAYQKYPSARHLPLIQDGDVHYLADFLGNMVFELNTMNLHELKLALLHSEGRRYYIE
jgi:PHP family Zn ribbon phosphoesterase